MKQVLKAWDYCENIVESRLVGQCAMLRVLCEKILHRPGWPDREIYWPRGTLHLVETKRPIGGKYEARQKETIRKLRAMGYTVYVLRTKEQVDKYIQRCLKQFDLPITLMHRITKVMSAKQFKELKKIGLL